MEAQLDRRLRVLIVDDSATVRRTLTEWLQVPDIKIVGTAIDPWVARDKIVALAPDVVLLDIDLPRMSGLVFLRRLMRFHPMPVIVVSALAAPGSEAAIEALEAGAFDVFHKPAGPLSAEGMSDELLTRIRSAARFLPPPKTVSAPARTTAVRPTSVRRGNKRQLIVMAASTGGTEAIKAVLEQLPADLPGICIVQHISAGFSRGFADRLNLHCAMEVREAAEGDVVRPGVALIAPGDFHMELRVADDEYVVHLHQAPRVHYQRPAADLLFESAARCAGAEAMGILLTGMGKDGAAGLKRLRDAGARTIAQNKATCVVFGMPMAAQALGAVEQMLPLPEIPGAILSLLNAPPARLSPAA